MVRTVESQQDGPGFELLGPGALFLVCAWNFGSLHLLRLPPTDQRRACMLKVNQN